MSDTQSATGTSAATTAPATDTETAVQKAVAQVKEARAKELSLKGMPELAKIFRDEKPKAAPDAGAPEAPKPTAAVEEKAGSEPAKTEGSEQAPAAEKTPDEKAAEEAAARRAARVKELSELARSGREKWQAREAQKQRSGEFEKRQAELEARAKEIEAQKAKLEAATKDPFKFLESLGVPPEELAKRVIKRGDPLSQAEELRAELESMRREIADRETAAQKAQQEREERERQASIAAQRRQAEAAFVRLASDESKFPSLNALYSPDEILAKAHRVAAAARAADPDAIYEDSEIAEHLEHEASLRLQKLRGAPPAPKAPEKTTESPAVASGQTEQGQKSRTLSSELQSEIGVDTEAFKKLPRSKQNQIIGETLKRLTSRKS